jgi:hypothetical protein
MTKPFNEKYFPFNGIVFPFIEIYFSFNEIDFLFNGFYSQNTVNQPNFAVFSVPVIFPALLIWI